MKRTRFLILLILPLLAAPAEARRSGSGVIGKRAGRHAAPLVLVSPTAPKLKYAPHDIAHAGPRLGVKFFENGLRVAYVDKGSPAAKAGLSANDIVRTAGGRAVQSHQDFAAAINAAATSGKLRISLVRAGKPREAAISLSASR